MVQPVTLKKRHSLKGLTLFPVLRKMNEGGGSVTEYARISSTKKTDTLALGDIGKAISDITGEPMDVAVFICLTGIKRLYPSNFTPFTDFTQSLLASACFATFWSLLFNLLYYMFG